MKSEVTGIILAGGHSKRMGTNKAFVRFKGIPLIEYALNALQDVATNVILSTGIEPLQYKNLPVVKDVYPGNGPMGGIYSALRFSNIDLNLVLSCDMPFVSADLLNYLVEEATEHYADVTLPADEKGYLQPLCAIYSKNILDPLEMAIVERKLKLKSFISDVYARIIPIEKTHIHFCSNAFLNMNTPYILNQTEKQ